MATDPKDTVYNTRKLSKWFALGSITLLVVLVWAVLQDYDRPWKRYARQSQKIAAAVGERRLKQAEQALNRSKLNALESELAQLQKEQAELVREADEKIAQDEARYYRANQDFQFAKANLDALGYELEEALKHLNPSAVKLKKEYREKLEHTNALQAKADTAERTKHESLALKKDILSQQKDKSARIEKLMSDIDRLNKVIANNEMSVGNLLRNAPIVDFIAPTVKINQVVLPHLKDDYFFNKVPRVDRCMTCHATIDKPGFEKFPQPFRTHSQLGLIAGPDSPHSIEKVGCTTCHGGVPQSVDFSLAAHTPENPAQEEEWHHKYGYHRSEHIGTPMMPLAMTEGKCLQCHAQQSELPGAPTFNAGMRLIERYGCYGCHKLNQHFEKLAQEKKPGPTLDYIASKVTPEWMTKWLWEPSSFRPTTLMPRYWKNHNNSDKASLARSAVEIESIVHYLYKRSQAYEPLKLASHAQGDIERGKKLVGSVGCLGCHAVEDFPRKNLEGSTTVGFQDPRVPMFGPELNQMGSKVTQAWLESWLKQPQHYWPGTAMPSLKLSDQEVADVAAYLLSKRNEAFENLVPPVSPQEDVRDQLVRDYLNKKLTPEATETKLASMSLEEKKNFLGEKFVNHYGCYGCHAIQGFEHAANIGAELTYEGSKDVSKFAFENVEIFHKSRADWVFTKVRTPRIWDVGKNRDFEGKTRMPQFNLNHDQATAIAAIVLGHENKNVDDEATFKVDGRWEQIIAGQRLLRQKNCIGCHIIGQTHGEILAHYPQDASMGPPNLNTEGQKVQTDWLYAYLANPNVMIRPWLSIRMPQFHMNSDQITTLTKYFAAYDQAAYPFVAQHVTKHLNASEVGQAEGLIKQLDCLSCHGVRKPGEDVSAAAPHFKNIKARLRGPWVVRWLHDPQAIMPGTRMPTLWPLLDDSDPKGTRAATPGYFGDDAEKQMEALRNYLFMYPGEPELPTPREDLASSRFTQ